MASMDTGIKCIHDKLAIEMNRFQQKTDILEWIKKEETTEKAYKKKPEPTTTDP